MHSSCGIHRIDLFSLGVHELLPVCQLKSAVIVLKPNEAKITPLTSRDIIPNGRQIYQNILQYNLHLSKQQEISIYVPLLSSLLYECEYESQLWMLFDINKMMIASGDAYSHSNAIKVDKGDYVLRLQIRHEKKDLLEKISEATVIVSIKLQNPISMDIYDHYNQALIAGKKIATTSVINGVPKSIFIAPLTSEKFNKASFPQSTALLSGMITYFKDETVRKCDFTPFNYVLFDGYSNNSSGSANTGSNSTNNNTSNNTSNNNTSCSSSLSTAVTLKKPNTADVSPKKSNKMKFEEYKDALRDFKCTMISKLGKFNNIVIK